MKITLDTTELQEIVNNYVKNTLGIEGTVTIGKDGVTIDTNVSAIKKTTKEESKKEEPVKKEEPTKEPVKEEKTVVDRVTNTVTGVIEAAKTGLFD